VRVEKWKKFDDGSLYGERGKENGTERREKK
jgi:hypothetical protein